MNFTKLAILGRAAAVSAVLAGALTAVPATAQAATTGVRVWFHPGDQFMPSTIWRFDSASHTGFKRSFIPSVTAWPVQRQTTFSYEKSEATYTLHTYPYGGTERITGIDYSSAADTWVVDNNGFTEKWYGCRSAGRPVYAQVAC